MARESMPSAWIRSSSSGIRLAPSRREYSLCVWRWTNAIRLAEDIGGRVHCQNRTAPDILRPMRGIASLFALGLMMALFHRVTAGAAVEARATLALGFLLLAAFLGGDLARRARLPRITGYVLVGFVVGPWLGLVRHDEVDALRFIGDVALGVIALAAGSELALPPLRGQLVALGRRGGRDRSATPRRCGRAPVVESLVPAHGAPAHRRRGGGRARARGPGGRVVTRRGDGYAQRARGRRPVRAHAPGRYGTQGRRCGDPVQPAARSLARRRRLARLRRESLPAAAAAPHAAVPWCRRPGCSRGGARRAARDHPRRARRRALPREFLPGRGRAGASRAETGVAVRLHLILRPGGCRPAPERVGRAVAVGAAAGGAAGHEPALRPALGGTPPERDSPARARGMAWPGAAGGERTRAGSGGPARVSRVGGLARDPRASDDWGARGGRADLLPPGAPTGGGNHGGHCRCRGVSWRDCRRSGWSPVARARRPSSHRAPARARGKSVSRSQDIRRSIPHRRRGARCSAPTRPRRRVSIFWCRRRSAACLTTRQGSCCPGPPCRRPPRNSLPRSGALHAPFLPNSSLTLRCGEQSGSWRATWAHSTGLRRWRRSRACRPWWATDACSTCAATPAARRIQPSLPSRAMSERISPCSRTARTRPTGVRCRPPISIRCARCSTRCCTRPTRPRSGGNRTSTITAS